MIHGNNYKPAEPQCVRTTCTQVFTVPAGVGQANVDDGDCRRAAVRAARQAGSRPERGRAAGAESPAKARGRAGDGRDVGTTPHVLPLRRCRRKQDIDRGSTIGIARLWPVGGSGTSASARLDGTPGWIESTEGRHACGAAAVFQASANH